MCMISESATSSKSCSGRAALMTKPHASCHIGKNGFLPRTSYKWRKNGIQSVWEEDLCIFLDMYVHLITFMLLLKNISV